MYRMIRLHTRRALLAATLLCGQALAAPADYTLTTLAEGLDNPWGLAFLEDGSMLVTERVGQLRRVAADGEVGPPISGVPPVLFRGQGGLFDVLPDPDFAANGVIYLAYAHGDMSANATRLAKARLAGNALEELEVIFTATPDKARPQHFGGRLLFLPDGTLLLTTGDGFDYREQAQNRGNTLK